MRTRAGMALAAIALVALVGCASGPPPVYFWGSYEDLLYEMYAKPGSADPGLQVQKLTEDVERALAQGQRVPPGVRAHLGYMHYLNNEPDRALEQFELEKKEYPEAEVFIDGMTGRMTRP